ncbi:MAG: hypothetical protein Q7T01_03045 [bacterium]|nr:hypothetical protein [bacterium]
MTKYDRPPQPTEAGDDFTNIDAVDEALASDDAKRVAAVRAWLTTRGGMTDREVDASIATERLRRSVHDAMRIEHGARIARDPKPTPEEWSMGAFVESVEPQVRQAVRTLRRKGYNTMSSGFWGFHYQSTRFAEPVRDALDAETLQRLAELGAEVHEQSIRFSCAQQDLAQIAERWNAIADVLPDLGRPASDTDHGAAQTFRQRYGGGV